MSPSLMIRKEQMDVFSEHLSSKFIAEMVLHLRQTFHEQTKDILETELSVMIQTGIETAERYGVIGVDDVRRHLEYMVILGQHFDKHPLTSWVGEILRQPTLDGTAKMDEIEEHMLWDSSLNT